MSKTTDFNSLVQVTERIIPKAKDDGTIRCPHCIGGSSIINGGMDSWSISQDADGNIRERSVRYICCYCGGTGYLKRCPTCGGVGGCKQ